MTRSNEKRLKGPKLKTGFTSKLFLELLVGVRQKKNLVTHLHKDLGIGWRNLSMTDLRDIPISMLMRIVLNYAYQTDKEQFVAICAALGARIYDYSDLNLDDFNNQDIDDPEEEILTFYEK